jgi:signal transduction histidine kinase
VKKTSVLIWSVIIWLVFVVSLTAWWMIFSLRTIRRLGEFVTDDRLQGQHDMLLMEGGVLIFLLIVGGSALVALALREKKHYDQVRLFFSTFTHDMKTSISRLLLQSEELATGDTARFKDFQRNIFSLEFQLENSLQIAQFSRRRLLSEKIDMRSIVSRLHQYWPNIKLTLSGKGQIQTDVIALESILRNIVSNSMIHGQADELKIKIEETDSAYELTVTDNGQPAQFNFTCVGQEMVPSTKGSGVGLFLISQWVNKLGGTISYESVPTSSIKVVLRLPLIKESL